MSQDFEMELVKSHKSMKEKSIYFLMAAAGACIGFALTQAKDLKLEWQHAWLATALACWSLSFLFGFWAIRCALAVTWLNGELLQVRSGKHPLIRGLAEAKNEAANLVLDVIESKNSTLLRVEMLQVSLLILGVVAYVVWQVLLMIQRTI